MVHLPFLFYITHSFSFILDEGVWMWKIRSSVFAAAITGMILYLLLLTFSIKLQNWRFRVKQVTSFSLLDWFCASSRSPLTEAQLKLLHAQIKQILIVHFSQNHCSSTSHEPELVPLRAEDSRGLSNALWTCLMSTDPVSVWQYEGLDSSAPVMTTVRRQPTPLTPQKYPTFSILLK